MISKRVAPANDTGGWAEGCELLMMTSATLIEALYEAVDDYLLDKSKTSIRDLNEKERLVK